MVRLHSCKISYLALCLFSVLQLAGQKGLPAKKTVHINHTTNFPQHLDFTPSLLSKLKVPAGWRVSVAASGLGKPRMLAMGQQGELYITRRDAGDVLFLKDSNNDQRFDEMKTIVSEFKGVHGIALKDNWIYLCSNRELRRYRLQKDGSVSTMELLMDDLPDGGQHGNRTMAFGPDGYLYLSVGSTCNDCFETNKENATMLQIDTLTWKRTIYARGLRNTIGFDWHPQTKEMYGMDNGSDAKGDDIPPEELNKIAKDKDYGWPLVYGKQVVDETREEPVGSTKAAYAKLTEASLMEFPAHSAPIDFKFVPTPASSSGDESVSALVCWHGSWNKKNPDGFKVQRIFFQKDKPSKVEDFLSGFLTSDRRSRFGRPAGIAISATDKVYISDDANGIIYCVQKIQ